VDQNHFERLTKALIAIPSRRDVLRGLSGLGLALGVARLPVVVDAKKRKHKKKKKDKKAKPNAFGCLEVGDPCKSADQCCSGICEGKKCRSHDTGTCNQEAPGVCEEGNPPKAHCNGSICWCLRTTAGSNFCGNTGGPSACADCQKDADCEALGFPSGSACVPYSEGNCSYCGEGGMACVVPCGTEPSED
jgi:hypothetical protein